MPPDPRVRYQQILTRLAELTRRVPEQALQKLEALLLQRPADPNFLHLKGLAKAALGAHEDAVLALRASLLAHPQQPEVHNNLGNSLRALGDIEGAEGHYRDAIALKPDYVDALKNLGLLLLASKRLAAAGEILQAACKLAPDDPAVLTALGDVYRGQEDYDQAISSYEAALKIAPDHVTAIHNLGLCHKLREDPQGALACFERAALLAPAVAEIDLNLGNAAFELRDYERAEYCYENAIAKDPGYVLAHESLSELRWQLGREDDYTASYRQVLVQRPRDMALRQSLLRLLINSQHFAEARELVNESLRIERTPELLRASGELYANDRDFQRARESFETSLQLARSLDVAHDLARLFILEADYPAALKVLEALQQEEPDNQLTWALIGTCWRLLDDPRYHWLIDYQRDVRVFTLPTPAGYGSLQEFLQTLQAVLLGMHSTRAAPMRQTLVSGTQTPGRLLHKPHPVIRQYRDALAEAVSEYIAGMPDDPSHPLFARKSSSFEFSGSWSVKLRSGGYHVNHVHPEGWISSACYIHLPGVMAEATGTAGCIKFGESALNLGEREVIERVVRPEAGQLALFPSYAWHGTFDFECPEDDFRLTAPFDVIPVRQGG